MSPQRIVLIGNHQAGKSRLFTQLTNSAMGETDLSGATLEIKQAETPEGVQVVDTPGLNSLFSQDPAQSLTRAFLVAGEYDQVVVVCDALNPKRSLALVLQATLLGKPLVAALSKWDLAAAQGITADTALLSKRLKVEVVALSGATGEGVLDFMGALERARPQEKTLFDSYLEELSQLAEEGEVSLPLARLAFAHVPEAREVLGEQHGALLESLKELSEATGRRTPFMRLDVQFTDMAFTQATLLTRDAFTSGANGRRISSILGRAAMRPLTGLPMAVVMLFGMYLWVGKFGATWLVDTINDKLFSTHVVPFLGRLISHIPWGFLRDALMDPDFGVITTGLFLAMGIVLPVLFTYYLFVGFLEDMGYFPRLSVLLDRIMRPFGLNGKGVMPLLMGFSCITMAIVTTRVLKTKKERIIATLLLILGVPCAPLLATMFIILGKLHWSATFVIFGIIFSQILFAGFMANRLLKGELPEFVMELTPFRVPRVGHVVGRTLLRTWEFLKEALPLFMFASFVLFILARIGFLLWMERGAQPLVEYFWGLPKESVQVLIKTIIRRENGVAELAHLRHLFSGTQAIVIMLLMTFLLPCVNATLMMIKERGLKVALGIIGTVFVYATLAAGAVNGVFHLFGVTY